MEPDCGQYAGDLTTTEKHASSSTNQYVNWATLLFFLVAIGWSVWACVYNFGKGIDIAITVALILLGYILLKLARRAGCTYEKCLDRVNGMELKHATQVRVAKSVVMVSLASLWVFFDVLPEPRRLVPLLGMLCLYTLVYITSANRAAIQWTTVFGGVAAQLIFGAVFLRIGPALDIGNLIHQGMRDFFGQVESGLDSVFSAGKWQSHYFAFFCLSTVLIAASANAVLVHVGWYKHIFYWISRGVNLFLNVTPVESFAAVVYCFAGQVETPVILKPFLRRMTNSEMHACMTCGFATLSGCIYAYYLFMGVAPPIAASIIAAPAALAIAKLNFPETERVENRRSKAGEEIHDICDDEVVDGAIQAAVVGATNSVPVITGMGASIIAFVSIFHFFDDIVLGIFLRVGFENVSITTLGGYVLWPLAFLMGAPTEDCGEVSRLLAFKSLAGEIESLQMLDVMQKNGEITQRGYMVARYAMGGFVNVAAFGMQIGAWTRLAPDRKHEFAQVLPRAYLCGIAACCTTACIAGMFHQE